MLTMITAKKTVMLPRKLVILLSVRKVLQCMGLTEDPYTSKARLVQNSREQPAKM